MRTNPDWMQWDRAGKVVVRRWYADYAGASGTTIVDDPRACDLSSPGSITGKEPLRPLAPTLFERMGEAQRLPPVKPPRPRRGQ